MCGRFACPLCISDLEVRLNESNIPIDSVTDGEKFRPSYNVAPRTWVLAIYLQDNKFKWGFIPTWAKQLTDNQPINAREETLVERSPVFDNAKHKRRCIIVADGFYEWKKDGKKKTPFYTKRKDGKLMLFAGLYDISHIHDDPLHTCAIVTTSSSSFFSFLHDRMPVILENGTDQVHTWLDTSIPWGAKQTKLLHPFEGKLDCYQVTDRVGPVSNNSPDFVVPVDELKGSIKNFFQKAPLSVDSIKKEDVSDSSFILKSDEKQVAVGNKRKHENDEVKTGKKLERSTKGPVPTKQSIKKFFRPRSK